MLSTEGTSECIHYGELFTAYPEVIRTVISRTDLSENVFLSEADDVLMPTSDVTPNGLAKACCMKLRDVIIGGDVLVIRTDQQRVDGEFLARYIRRLEQRVLQFVTGSTVYHLYATSLAKLDLCVPKMPEQQKIADCLGSLDDLIAVQRRKLEALRQHKQGLMQQLFPQPGETVPRLRFREFQDQPEWDLRTLSSVSSVNPKSGSLPEQFIYIDLESVKNSILIERKEISRDVAPSRAQRLLGAKDIIFQTVRPYQRNNLFFDISDGCEYVASTGYAQLRAHQCPEFLYQLLHTDSFVSSVLARCTGSNYPAINPSELASIGLLLPSKSEQQKIADCLGSLDDLIVANCRKLETLRKGLIYLTTQIPKSILPYSIS